MLLGARSNPAIKHRAPYRRSVVVERTELELDIVLPHFHEEEPDSFVVLWLVEEDEFHVAGSDEGRDCPLVESIDCLQIHRSIRPLHILHRVQARIRDHHDHMPVLLPLPSSGNARLLDARRPGQGSDGAAEGRGGPAGQLGGERGCGTGDGARGDVGQRVEGRIEGVYDEEVVRHRSEGEVYRCQLQGIV